MVELVCTLGESALGAAKVVVSEMRMNTVPTFFVVLGRLVATEEKELFGVCMVYSGDGEATTLTPEPT